VHHDGITRRFYACSFRLDAVEHFFLWYSREEASPDPDRVLLDDARRLVTLGSLEALTAYAAGESFALEPGLCATYDFDSLIGWCSRPSKRGVDCKTFLGAWNLFDDMLLSSGRSKLLFDGVETFDEQVYDKLFWGNNIPAMTPEGQSYEPIWSKHELSIMVDAFRQGLAHLRRLLVGPPVTDDS
jgi:hypothetical protein